MSCDVSKTDFSFVFIRPFPINDGFRYFKQFWHKTYWEELDFLWIECAVCALWYALYFQIKRRNWQISGAHYAGYLSKKVNNKCFLSKLLKRFLKIFLVVLLDFSLVIIYPYFLFFFGLQKLPHYLQVG